jgi:hypothetical protein
MELIDCKDRLYDLEMQVSTGKEGLKLYLEMMKLVSKLKLQLVTYEKLAVLGA